ncbi:hypothetical protein ABG067_007474 [Albugo candida]|uniref:Uncharacterized protein n=1 Tax=Albugo candida TaxID=65357 RepID=A0A024FXH2_9STRA|nr:unnamed protein product [Albugo candida]|eukprot:CCI11726.1 unnamed protein product [Albugo candida]
MLLATTYILVFALQYSIGLEVPVCVTSLKLLGDLHILIKIPVKLSNPNAEETFFGLTSNDITEASTIANTYKGVELQMNMIRAGYSLKPLGATLLFEEASIYRSRSFIGEIEKRIGGDGKYNP